MNTTTWLLADEAAEYMRMHRITVYRLLQRGELQGKKVGKHWHIRTDWCDAYLMGETV
ncbi:excisionase family DNA-binding protein [Corynebacterium sp. KPL4064]|uniref:excisionase family DNA-binding protein n=1 Tax=Corynebacterium sp. KPL4064 TaxID=3158329 RepID=UPI0032EC3381